MPVLWIIAMNFPEQDSFPSPCLARITKYPLKRLSLMGR